MVCDIRPFREAFARIRAREKRDRSFPYVITKCKRSVTRRRRGIIARERRNIVARGCRCTILVSASERMKKKPRARARARDPPPRLRFYKARPTR